METDAITLKGKIGGGDAINLKGKTGGGGVPGRRRGRRACPRTF